MYIPSFVETMIGLSLQCYIPSFVEIGLPVLEKIFEGFLPYMGVSAILVIRPGPFINWPASSGEHF